MNKNEGISKKSIQSLISFFADPNSKDSITKKYQKNNKSTENRESKSTASASKSKTVTRLKKQENVLKKRQNEFFNENLYNTTYEISANDFKEENTKLQNTVATTLEDNKRYTDEMLNQNTVRNISQRC